VGKRGRVTELIPNFADWADQVFACGPMPMYQEMKKLPYLNGKDVQISLEVRMGCGLGVCYGCTVKTKNGLKQVCKDGPIFDLNDILWDELNC
jgi:dihydroorotate dehydrogenase electron transfer subunit